MYNKGLFEAEKLDYKGKDQMSILSRFFRKQPTQNDELPVVINGRLVEEESLPQDQDNTIEATPTKQEKISKETATGATTPQQGEVVGTIARNDEEKVFAQASDAEQGAVPSALIEEVPEDADEDPPRHKAGRLPGEKGLLKVFLEHIQANGFSQKTVAEYRYDLKILFKYSREIAKTHPLKLTIPEMEGFVVFLEQEKKNKSAIIRRKLSTFSSFCKWAMKRGLPRPPINLVTRPKMKRDIPKFISDEDFLKIGREVKINAKECVLCAQVGMMSFCGVRVSEISTARVINSNIIIKGKGNKERIVPAPNWIINAIKQHENNKEWKANRRTIWKKTKERWGYSPHQFRHTFATYLLSKGMHINEIRDLLGHEDISTTTIYARTKSNNKSVKLLDI